MPEMQSFVIAASVLALIAIALILLPLWIARQRTSQQQSLNNIQVVKGRLAELKREQAEGLLSEQDRLVAEKELKLALLDEVPDEQAYSEATGKLPLFAIAISIVVLILGVFTYTQVNQIAQMKKPLEAQLRLPDLGRRIVVEADPNVQASDLQTFALGIRSKLREDPTDATGWLLLGRLHGALNQIDSALQAFQKGLAIQADHQGLLSSYSQTLLMTGQEGYIREAKFMLQRLLRITPNDSNAIGMLAVAATQLNENEYALENWQKLQDMLPQSDPSYAAVSQRIQELQARIAGLDGSPMQSNIADNAQAAKDEIKLLIDVTLDEKLAEKLPENGYLFVFAQSADGNTRMPAAVVRIPLPDLPIQVVLSNTNAMIASYNLSQLSEAKLVARISADENVATAPGELQGEVLITLASGEQQQKITINEELL